MLKWNDWVERMNSTPNWIYISILIALVLLFGYMAYGEEELPTPKEIALQQRARLLEEQKNIDLSNLKILSYCNEYASGAKADERQKSQYDCYRTQRIPDLDIPNISTWTLMTGSTVIPPKELDELFNNVCKSKPSSPICDRATFDRLYKITEDRLPWKNFFPILLGITNAESSLGTAFAKNNKGWYCTGYNNLGGVKYKKDDEWKSIRDQKIPQSDWCYLYKFESIDDYWISKVNTIRYGYKWCINSKTPIDCIGRYYVQWNGLSKPNWNKNVSIFLQ